MSQIPIGSFIGGINSIIAQKPSYKVGHDGSDNTCDGLGLIRGGLLRGGATKIKYMRDLNQFVRKVALNVQEVGSDVKVGSIVLATRSANDELMPLPSRFRDGGEECTGDKNNYTDIGVVIAPSTVVRMTTDGVVKENGFNGWSFICWLPYVIDGGRKSVDSVSVKTEASVKLFTEPKFASTVLEEIPQNTRLFLLEENNQWSKVSYGSKTGFVLSKFLKREENVGLKLGAKEMEELEKAYLILGKILGYIK